ncbi:MAG: hypothetical protein HY681_12405 [Chloroflexi bacterium]|nr:hypothetical protein [Chloroflexota bacterium]
MNEVKEAVEGDLPRWDEVMAGVDFALSKNPYMAGVRIGNSDFYYRQLNTTPMLVIYYTVEENVVVLRHVLRIDS